MAAPKRPTHRVCKAGLYFTPAEGEMPVGTQLTLTKDQADKLEKRGLVEPLKDAKTVDVSDADSKELKKVKADLNAANKALQDKDAELVDVKEQLAETQAELEKANKALTDAAGVKS